MSLDRRPAPEVRAADPTPTLQLLAGEYAARVATLWPPPHGAYLEMPAQRRHLVHIVLDFAPRANAEALRYGRADAVVRDTLGQMPAGFARLLGRLGEIAWTGYDYLTLVGMFSNAAAAVVLRQSEALSPARVHALEALAPPLRTFSIARHLTDPALAALLADAWRAVVAVRGDIAGARAAQRWARACTPERLFAMAAHEMAPSTFAPAPFPEHPDLRRLDGAAALADAGRRFHNCLAIHRDRAAEGMIALYEWAGPPPAALALARDGFFGWRLEEARGFANAALDEAARAGLTAALRDAGVRVGRSGRDLEARLLRAAGLAHAYFDENETPLTPFGL